MWIRDSVSKNISLSVIATVIFICFTLSGSTHKNSMYISLALLIIWVATAFLSNYVVFMKSLRQKQVIAFCVYLFFIFFTAIFKAGIFYTLKLIGGTMIIFSPIIIYLYYYNLNKDKLKLIVKLSLFYFIYLSIKSISFYKVNENAARRIAANEEVYGDIALGGGYALAYGAVLLIVYLTDLLVNKKITHRKNRFLIYGIIIILIYLVILTKSTLTIIWLFIGMIITIIFRDPRKFSKSINKSRNLRSISFNYILKIFSMLLLSIIVVLSSTKIGLLILNNTNGTDVLSMRFREIGYSLAYGLDSSEYLISRLLIPIKSILAFLKNPLIGRGYEYGYVADQMYYYIGGHGEWADALGSLGMLGTMPYFLVYYYSIKAERRIASNKIPSNYILIVILLGLFNPLKSFQAIFILMLVLPTITEMLINNNIDNSSKGDH